MKFTTRVKNAYEAFSGENKTQNSAQSSRADFLRSGRRNPALFQDWSQVEMSDQDMYTGYSYAVINKRANRASALGKSFLYTEASQAVMDATKKAEKELEHPYLKLIRTSKDFSRRRFWHDISTYLDLEGVYYLMAVRAIAQNKDGTPKVGAVQSFQMLNPYNVRRVTKQSDGTVGGYIESRDGMYREIPKEMIIEVRLLNPFDNEKAYSMTDAAKESQFTMKQAGDYTRHSIKGNINAPGAITTDVVLEDNIFDNFVSRIQNHSKGEPLYGNGAGAIKWESMQIDLDKASLDKINDIHRSVLFSVGGVSDMLMGQQKAGTGREVSKTQKDEFTENAIMPQVEDILDALNLDYRRWYPEWEKDEYEIVLDNPLESDREAELKDIEIREAELALREELVNKGYEYELANKYAHGDISLEELGEPTLEPEITQEEADAEAEKSLGIASTDDEEEPQDGNEVPGMEEDDKKTTKVTRRKNSVFSKATNKFVKPEENEKRKAEALKKATAKKKVIDSEAKKAKKKPTIESKPEMDGPAPIPTVKVEVVAPTANAMEEKALNQISSKDYPDLYEGMDIDFDDLGCIMINTEKIPVMQYMGADAEKDLWLEQNYDQGAVPAETVPHATLLFGLLENGNIWKDKVDMVLDGWKMPKVKIDEVSFFDIGEAYAVVALLEKTPEIIDGHERLTLLPHINTFSEYHPHITLAYITKDANVEDWVKALGKRYNGKIISTKGINYGDLPEKDEEDDDPKADNHVEDEHNMENLPKAKPVKKKIVDNKDEAILSLSTADKAHNHDEHSHESNSTLEKALNELDPAIKDSVVLEMNNLQNAVAQLESQIAAKVIERLRAGDIRGAEDLISEAQEESFVQELIVILVAYYTIVFPIYASQLLALRLATFGLLGVFRLDDAIAKYIDESADNAARSHVKTVLKDFARVLDQTEQDLTKESLIEVVKKKARERDASIMALLPANPNDEDIVKAVLDGKFDATPAYKLAREKIREGQSLDKVIRAITAEYGRISTTRAKVIARHESSRVFNMAQYQADVQFLTTSGLMPRAYKRLRSRTGDPCPICNMLIESSRLNPIPFEENFADLGAKLSASYRKPNGTMAVMMMPITYEAITAGNVHVHCNCEYELVIKNEDGTFQNNVDARVDNAFDPSQKRDKDGKWTDGGISVGFDGFESSREDNAKFISKQGSTEGSNEERRSLSYYFGTGYTEINEVLRYDGNTDRGVYSMIEEEVRTVKDVTPLLDAVMKKNETKEDFTAYRVMSGSRSFTEQFVEGAKFQDKGYVSTTLSGEVLEHFEGDEYSKDIVMRIPIKKGTKGVFANNTTFELNDDPKAPTTLDDESEFLLPRNTSFKVVSREEKDGKIYLEVEIV